MRIASLQCTDPTRREIQCFDLAVSYCRSRAYCQCTVHWSGVEYRSQTRREYLQCTDLSRKETPCFGLVLSLKQDENMYSVYRSLSRKVISCFVLALSYCM